MLEHARYRPVDNGDAEGIPGEAVGECVFDDRHGGAKTALIVADSARGLGRRVACLLSSPPSRLAAQRRAQP